MPNSNWDGTWSIIIDERFTTEAATKEEAFQDLRKQVLSTLEFLLQDPTYGDPYSNGDEDEPEISPTDSLYTDTVGVEDSGEPRW
jgi:hypothetical protein